jgi:hypothetical protein
MEEIYGTGWLSFSNSSFGPLIYLDLIFLTAAKNKFTLERTYHRKLVSHHMENKDFEITAFKILLFDLSEPLSYS